jgi:hypothetical protein
MEIYYLIDGEKYMDTFLLRDKLELSKSELQHLMTKHNFPEKDVIKIQNKKLYSVNGLNGYIQMLINGNEG